MKNKKISLIIALLYFVLCLTISFNRIPFWDEARGWLIAQNCNFFEYLDLMKLECHMFIWYLVIFPFAKLNLIYPYSIYVLNTIFVAYSIYFLWKKSPFNYLEKTLITFSVPFLFLWGCVARCYSIGILFIFLALIYYKARFKKPFKYFMFLCLAMNTSVMAFIGSFWLALIFLFENIKSKNIWKLLGVFAFSLLIIAIQIYSPNPDFLKQAPEIHFLRDFLGYIFIPVVIIPQFLIQSVLMSILRISIDIFAIVFSVFCLKNNKKAFFFIFACYFSMTVLLTLFYSGNFWHYFYYYLYFIVSIWILKIENKKFSKVFNVLFLIILICFLFKGSLFIDSKMTTINDSKSKYIANEILTNENYQNKKLFCLDAWSDVVPSSLPYLKGKVKIYDVLNQDRFSFKSMRSQLKFNKDFFNPDEFYQYAEKDSILFTTSVFFKHEQNNPLINQNADNISFIGEKYIIEFIPLDKKEELKFYSYLIKVKKRT